MNSNFTDKIFLIGSFLGPLFTLVALVCLSVLLIKLRRVEFLFLLAGNALGLFCGIFYLVQRFSHDYKLNFLFIEWFEKNRFYLPAMELLIMILVFIGFGLLILKHLDKPKNI